MSDAVAAAPPGSRGRRRSRAQARAPLAYGAAVTLVVAALLWLYSSRQWALYQVPSWDLGIFTQLMRAYAELRSPIVPIKGEGFMLLGDHFHPLLVVLAPFYALHPSGFTLLAVQAVLFGLGAGIVTVFAVRALGAWGALIGLASGLSYLIVEAQAAQFHEIALAVPLLALSMGMLLERRVRAAVLWSLPLLGVKEDLGLTVAAIGFVALLRARDRGERAWAVAGMTLGVAGFVVVTQWVLPALNTGGVWDYADDSITSLILSDPGAALTQLTTGLDQKLGMIALPILVTCGLSLRSPLALVALPTLAWRVASDVEFHWGTAFHYGAVLAPIMYLALADGLLSLRASWRGRSPLPVVPVVSCATAVIALVMLPSFSLWSLTKPETWRDSDLAANARAAEAQVADGERVETDITLMAYLAPRAQVLWLGNANSVPDVMVLNAASGVFSQPPEDVAAYAAGKHPQIGWVNTWEQGSFGVARPE
ncbi:DUF2079 domain-containing protein [Serinibacter salmoneus]|uniref:Putative membrane protein DUF2079 n=1 Tax=Serinibacter salmoneus TaxID=556530 RepID=A0A2A9CYA5_9MICO|nr:DUF2079 domain-containing protein [Serinibacter salmoneus]PFG19121.1 putative membrane protein DUF2079 [Serinibacter salmoneus]